MADQYQWALSLDIITLLSMSFNELWSKRQQMFSSFLFDCPESATQSFVVLYSTTSAHRAHHEWRRFMLSLSLCGVAQCNRLKVVFETFVKRPTRMIITGTIFSYGTKKVSHAFYFWNVSERKAQVPHTHTSSSWSPHKSVKSRIVECK